MFDMKTYIPLILIFILGPLIVYFVVKSDKKEDSLSQIKEEQKPSVFYKISLYFLVTLWEKPFWEFLWPIIGIIACIGWSYNAITQDWHSGLKIQIIFTFLIMTYSLYSLYKKYYKK